MMYLTERICFYLKYSFIDLLEYGNWHPLHREKLDLQNQQPYKSLASKNILIFRSLESIFIIY